MIPKDCKRLAEVDFPIADVSRHAAREKSIRHGHPSTLHLWWARRPLASSRALLLALLWPDPCDPLCPASFKAEARRRLPDVPRCRPAGPADLDLRHALLRFIADFANWDHAAHPLYLDVSRALVAAAHAPADPRDPYEPPLVVDPFAGGGSIPLEALRVGCDAFASDLNPVACLILKVLLDDIPRHGPRLADDLRRVGATIKQQAEHDLADLYPPDPDGATPIAYLWARTVRCEAPRCGAEIPLVRSFHLCTKPNRRRALRHRVERPHGQPPRLLFEVFEPTADKEVPPGTVTRAKATCPCCGVVLPPERVRAQLAAQRGGADVVFDAHGRRTGGARLLAVVTLRPGETGRHYRLPTERDDAAVRAAHARLAALLADHEHAGRPGLSPVPDEPLPPIGTLGFRVQRYGMLQWGDLFTARQKVAMVRLGRLLGGAAPAKAARTTVELLALSLGKVLRHSNVLSKWHRGSETVAGAFGMQALPMSWDFPEMLPLAPYAGSIADGQKDVIEPVESISSAIRTRGQHVQADSATHPLPDASANIWFTDPPYYDAIPYSDLADFFFVWLKRVLPRHELLRDPFDKSNPLSPKRQEAVQDEVKRDGEGKRKDADWFEKSIGKAFSEGRRVLSDEGIGAVVFAHKTTEGWEALLSGITAGGWIVAGSWPIATERGARLRARESAALATSVHLVCRPRPAGAGVGDWGEVLRELPGRVAAWMERLQREGVRGADLVFACIGPALEVFSRHARVETPEGREVKLDEYLAKVWEVVGRAALEQVLGASEARARDGAAGALEEDARLTALFLWTLQATTAERGAAGAAAEGEDEGAEEEEGAAAEEEDEEEEGGSGSRKKGLTLVFDVVRRFAQPLGIELGAWEGRVVETKKGTVRLLPVAERARQLFGEEGAGVLARRIEGTAAAGGGGSGAGGQLELFAELEAPPAVKGSRGRGARARAGGAGPGGEAAAARAATTLDRVHAAMLLQAGGRTNALRALLRAEQERGPSFGRLTNALSALYPKGSEEKRLLDAMLLAMPR